MFGLDRKLITQSPSAILFAMADSTTWSKNIAQTDFIQWMEFTSSIESNLVLASAFLNHHLMFRTFVDGSVFSVLDILVWQSLVWSKKFIGLLRAHGQSFPHLRRWFLHLEEQTAFNQAVRDLNAVMQGCGLNGRHDQAQAKKKTESGNLDVCDDPSYLFFLVSFLLPMCSSF